MQSPETSWPPLENPTPPWTPYFALGCVVVLVWLLWFRLKLRRWWEYAVIFYALMLFAFIGATLGYEGLFNVAFPAWWLGFACAMMEIRRHLPGAAEESARRRAWLARLWPIPRASAPRRAKTGEALKRAANDAEQGLPLERKGT